MKKYYISVVSLVAACVAFAEIKLPAIFDSNMVVQQQMPINIWGTAKPKSEVMANFNSKYTKTKADSDGNWKMTLPAEKASFKERSLTLFEDGVPSLELKNVLVGEVWIAGGQSNMEWRVYSSADKKKAEANAEKNRGKFRYFAQSSHCAAPKPMSEFHKDSKWIVVDGKNVGTVSAVGYYFAERLLADLNVPVALIYAAQGATEMKCWTSREDLEKLDWLAEHLSKFEKETAAYDEAAYQKMLAEFKAKDEAYKKAVERAKKEGKPKPARARWDDGIRPNKLTPWFTFRSPYLNFNGFIAPLKNLSVRGVIWYQGESDANATWAPHYTESFGTMIKSWRESLKNPDLPFIQVQLASFKNGGKWERWADARAAQFENTKVYKNVFMACIIDCGEKHQIHPADKTTPGSRLEKIALEKVYGKKGLLSTAPSLKEVVYKGSSAVVTFDLFGTSLTSKGKPRGFEILVGENWVPAEVELLNEVVLVKSKGGAEIKGVRYLWKDWARPDVWLFGKQGLPVVPFKSVVKDAAK